MVALRAIGTIIFLVGSAHSAQNARRILTQEEANQAAAAAAVDGVVSGDRFVWFGIGDWGRCGSPTTNPATRARRCNSQLSLVPPMEAWALQVAPTFILSVGDQFYDGPMNPSGATDMEFPASAADLAIADADPIYDLSWRQIYNSPTLRSTQWQMFHGNHDYSGLLASQLNFGARNSGKATDDGFDKRWVGPDVNYTRNYPIGTSGAPGACIEFVYIDTCPLIATYRSTTLDPTDPDRRATTNIRPIFQKQINAIPKSMAQMAWFADQLETASSTCDAVVIGGHHAVYSSGQHARSTRQRDLTERLNLPGAFAWAGVDAYLNGHEHIVEVLADATTTYVVTGAGSDVRTNNILVPQSLYLLEDNAFTVHSANTTHMQHTVVNWAGTVMYTRLTPLRVKQRTAPTTRPNDATLNWLQPGYTP